jgi:tRNA pseudouridine38-40 synthase
MARRIRIDLAYAGAGFHGWQVQPGLPTIQGILEEILSGIEGAPVRVAGSGRTDAGVHAQAQVAAFHLNNPIPPVNLRRALNRLLPPAIRVMRAEEVADCFHPRFDAIAKTYEYRLFRGETCSPFLWPTVYHHPYPLDVPRMIELAPLFEGEHDFSAFAAADDRDALGRSKVRTIFSSQLTPSDGFLHYRVRGSGFLKHMVRNLVGTLLEVGKGNLDQAGLQRLLGPNPGRCGSTVPAKGLTLISVEYPAPASGTLAS